MISPELPKNEIFETNFEALNEAINQIDLDFDAGFDEVEYRNHLYYIYYTEDDYMETPARYRPSETGHYDIDVEVKKSLGDHEIRRAILHEVIEADLCYNQKMDMAEAHKTASKFDKQYNGRDLPKENST